MTLKLSSDRRRSSANCNAFLACSIDWPCIDPDVSMIKIASRGNRASSFLASPAGGMTMASI